MKTMLLACLQAQYETEFQKAEGMHRFFHKLMASPLSMIEKIELLFTPIDPEHDVRPFYSHIVELNQKDHPIRKNSREFLQTIFKHYENNIAEQETLVKLDRATLKALMIAKFDHKIILKHFFEPASVAKSLRMKEIHPQLVIRIMQECCVQEDDPELKEMAQKFKPEHWLEIISELKNCEHISETQLFELQFHHHRFFLQHVVRVENNDFHHKTTPINASHVTLLADWLSDPVLAIPRLFSESKASNETRLAFFRYGKVQQISKVIELLEQFLAQEKSKNTESYLQQLLLTSSKNTKPLLSELDARENGAFMLNTLLSWIKQNRVGQRFVQALLLESDFVSHLIDAHEQQGHPIINELIDKLDEWLRKGWLTKITLRKFLLLPQDYIIHKDETVYIGFSDKLIDVFFYNLGKKDKHKLAFAKLLNHLERWTAEKLIDHSMMTEILTTECLNLTAGVPVKSSAIAALSRYKNLDVLIEKIHYWVEHGYLTELQLKESLLGLNNSIWDSDITNIALLWNWIFRWYAERKITIETVITLVLYKDASSLLRHPFCNLDLYNTELQQQLIQKLFCLLNLEVNPKVAKQIDAQAFERLQLILKYVTSPKPFIYKEEIKDTRTYKQIELHPNTARVLFHIAFGFSDGKIFDFVTKKEIFDAILNLPEKELAMQIQLLRAANDLKKPLGQFFKMSDGSKLSSRLFRNDEWPTRLHDALKAAEAKFMPMQKQEQIAAFMPKKENAVSNESQSTPSNLPKSGAFEVIGIEGFEAHARPYTAIYFNVPLTKGKAASTAAQEPAPVAAPVIKEEKELVLPSVPTDEFDDAQFKDAESDSEEHKIPVAGR